MLGQKQLEQNEGNKADCRRRYMEHPELDSRHARIPPADMAHDKIGAKKGEVIDADDGCVEGAGRNLCKQSQAHGHNVREADAVK